MVGGVQEPYRGYLHQERVSLLLLRTVHGEQELVQSSRIVLFHSQEGRSRHRHERAGRVGLKHNSATQFKKKLLGSLNPFTSVSNLSKFKFSNNFVSSDARHDEYSLNLKDFEERVYWFWRTAN